MPEAPTTARPDRAAPAADEGLFCPQCGYSLRGLGGYVVVVVGGGGGGGGGPGEPPREVRCPECGFAVNLQTLHRSIIPWAHRAEIGRWRAYWRTVRLVSRRPRLVAGEASKPLRIEDAAGFRRVTAVLAFLPLAGLVVWGYVASLSERIILSEGMVLNRLEGPPAFRGHAMGWLLEWAVVAAVLLGLWLFILGVTGLPSYFFHPRRLTVVQQNRAIALSYFSCAALAWAPVSVGLFVGGLGVAGHRWGEWNQPMHLREVGTIACVLGGFMLLGQAVTWYADILTMLKRATYGSTGRVWSAALSLPPLALLLAVLTLVVLPACVALLGLIAISFR